MNTKLKTQFNKFIKQTFFIGLLFSSSAFVFLRLMIYPLPIEIAEDGIIFIKTVLTGWALVMLLRGSFEVLVFILELTQSLLQNHIQSMVRKTIIYNNSNFISEHLYQYKEQESKRVGKVRFYNMVSPAAVLQN